VTNGQDGMIAHHSHLKCGWPSNQIKGTVRCPTSGIRSIKEHSIT